MNPETGSSALPPQSSDDPRFRGKRYRQLVAAFNVYRASQTVAESIAPPRIYTPFRGVPFTCNAKVLAVGQKDVTFSIEPLQARAVERTGTSIIMSPLHAMTFRVMSTGVDHEHGRASFAQFLAQRRGGSDKRSNLRVEPERSIEVKMRCFGKEVTGSLLDVSVVSLAVSFSNEDIEKLEEGAPVEVFIPEFAPEFGASVEAEGRIIRRIPLTDQDTHQCGVVIYLRIDHKLFDRLERYVAVRRVAIIRELTGVDSPENGPESQARSA